MRGFAESGESVSTEVEFIAATRISGSRGTRAIGRIRGALPRLRDRGEQGSIVNQRPCP